METQIFWDILYTPEQLNSEKWKIKRCTGTRKTFETRKRIRSTLKAWLESTGEEKKWRMINLKLPEHLPENHQIRTLIEKNEGTSRELNGYLVKKSESLKQEDGRAGKTKAPWDGWNKHRWENLELILRMLKMIGSTWREAHRLEIELGWHSWWPRRINTPIETWEHHLEKVWNQHLTLKQLEYHK